MAKTEKSHEVLLNGHGRDFCTAAVLIVPFCEIMKREFIGAVRLFRLFLLIVLPSSFCTLMQSQWYSSGLFKIMSIANIVIGARRRDDYIACGAPIPRVWCSCDHDLYVLCAIHNQSTVLFQA